MKKILILVMILSLMACDRGSMEDAVRKELKDPDSAKFSDYAIYETRGCISYNAKNSYGGYVGSKIATLKKYSASGSWSVDNLQEISACDGYYLKKLYTADVAQDKMEKNTLERLKRRGDIPQTINNIVYIISKKELKELSENGPQNYFIGKSNECPSMLYRLRRLAWDNAYETKQTKKTALEKEIADGLTAIDKGICKN